MSGGHHHHHHDHSHSHAHGHSHAPASFGRAFAVGIGLNLAFVVVEAVYGVISGSMALVADAGHNLSDVLGLIIAWVASVLTKRPPSARFTYGFKSSSILAALGNAAFLLVALGAILVETIRRLFEPEPVVGGTVMIVAAVGIVINTATALMFMRGRDHDLNIRGAYLHMAADAAVSAGVVVAGLLIMLTGQTWIDPVTSLLIVGVIAWGTWGLLKDSLRMSLLGVPTGIDERKVRSFLQALNGVEAVHDLHIWSMSTTETALTAHLVMPGGHPGDSFVHSVSHQLDHDFSICHSTIQIETLSGEDCRLASHQTV
ncbi:MAG: cation transporter [Novosphingobium sp. 16-62-11]|uniref:cation diffusion facilitator family transporter n=1 Tax=Novosphingobium sp. 17-62-19 TaxID=1970406 RepID=UPI000BD75B6F|nr:cation diffusion facilitator family transporter [Novosphingobium sp. 17-62-19]OYX94021.1 MAG: cation transporter [Novosphingobium sp. 35-62-5]OYZ46029.1 MAG: cation transporter [Novosphingobium sp. 16-62-11]OZA16497.1 MAG: cation transporter [Novosphingobium sp. 17-62-19]HQS98481.1 cation diffusion facilitator family transporter [Novosphingobium sp.]